MSGKKISHTTYHDHKTTTPFSGDTSRRESDVDMEEFHRVLEQVHAAGAHDWGVAMGLAVTMMASGDLKVDPGIALDALGRHISLDADSKADVGKASSALDVLADPISQITKSADGTFLVPTKMLVDGKYLLTIQWAEAYYLRDPVVAPIDTYEHTPWIRLIPEMEYVENGIKVVLAKVTLSGAKATAITAEQRRSIGAHVERLTLVKSNRQQKAMTDPVVIASASPYGVLQAREGGGVRLSVPDANDELEIIRDGGSFSKLTVNAKDTALQGTLTISQNLTAASDAEVTGILKVKSTLNVEGTLTAASLFKAKKAEVETLSATGPVQANSSLDVQGTLTAASLFKAKKAEVETLSATGSIQANSSLDVQGTLTAASLFKAKKAEVETLSATGPVQANSSLDVQGTLTAASLFKAKKAEVETLSATGPVQANSSLDVQGTLTAASLFKAETAQIKTLTGKVSIKDSMGSDAASLDGERGIIEIGTQWHNGELSLRNTDGADTIHAYGESGQLSLGDVNCDGSLYIYDRSGYPALSINGHKVRVTIGTTGNYGELSLLDKSKSITCFVSGEHGHITSSGNIGIAGYAATGFPVGSGRGIRTYDVVAHGTGYANGGWQTRAIDVAEGFALHDERLEAGDVVVVDPAIAERLIPSSTPYQETLLGVISEQPGFLLGAPWENDPKIVPLALAGRVPVKVCLENGPIRIGDYLTSSSQAGIAMKSTKPGRVIGMALQPLDKNSGQQDKIVVFINPHWKG